MRLITTYAARVRGYATKMHFNKLPSLQNKVLRIIIKFPSVIPVDVLHEQTAMGTIKSHFSKLAQSFYTFKASPVTIPNSAVRPLGPSF